jgi:hypothetical protein
MLTDDELERLFRRLETDVAPNPVPVDRAFEAIDQRRRGLVHPRRWPFLRAPAGWPRRIALAAAAVAIFAVGVGVGANLLGRPSNMIGGPPSPSPSASQPAPTPLPATELIRFRSTMYGYSIDTPRVWVARNATRALVGTEPPWVDSPPIDQFSAKIDRYGERSGDPGGTLIIAAADLSLPTTLQSWTDGTAIAVCGTPTTREAITIDAEPASLVTFATCYSAYHLWATVLHGGKAYHIVLLDTGVNKAADRVLFDQLLASFSFGN